MMNTASELLTVAEVAEWLRVEPRYIYRLASSGELIRVYIGRYVRIPAISVEEYIKAHTVEAVKPVRALRPGSRARRRLRAVEQDHPAYIPRPCCHAWPIVSYALRGCSFWRGAAAVLVWASGQHR